jgi:ubiquinone biosynthesis protein Coq4
MRAAGLDPAAIPTLPSTTEFEFIRAHLYETHDVWHAVTGFRNDVAGELGLQGFYAAQTPGGLPALLVATGLLNAVLFDMDDTRRRFDAIATGWEMGNRARPLFGVRWDRMWARPVDEVRRDLHVDAIGPLAAAA